MRRTVMAVVGGVVIGLLVVTETGWAKAKPRSADIYPELELFADALSSIESDYVDEVKPKDLIYGALKGMLGTLDDHSQFLDPETYNEMRVETEGQFGGLGIEIAIRDELLTIVSPIDDTPAWKAGLKAGDRVVKINGELTRGITLAEAVKKLRGEPGSQVVLTVLREAEKELLEIPVTRAIITIQSVKDVKMLDDGIGYIRLAEFQEQTPRDMKAAIDKLVQDGMDSLVLDLRNNPGGLLDVAVSVSEAFLERGQLVVTTQGRRSSQNLEFRVRSAQGHVGEPMVVLVNGGSASGSEIVAGAVQDNHRGILVGEKTFGKGSVQTIVPLRDGSALRLTTSKYFTPSGRCIHGLGIEPDVAVPAEERKPEATQNPEQEKKKPVDIFENLQPKEEQTPPKEDLFVKDRQLAVAVDILKGIKAYRALNHP